MNILRRRLRERREELGLSQADLARRMGYTQQMISKIENGESNPLAESLRAASEALAVGGDYLLGLTDDPAPAVEGRAAAPKTWDRRVGSRLATARQRAGQSRTRLAAALGETRHWVSAVEDGRAGMSIEHLVSSAKALRLSVDYLLGLTDDPVPPSERPFGVSAFERKFLTFFRDLPRDAQEQMLALARQGAMAARRTRATRGGGTSADG